MLLTAHVEHTITMDAHVAAIADAGFTVVPLFAANDLWQLRQHLQAWNTAQIAPAGFTSTAGQLRIPELLTVPEPGDVARIVTHPVLLGLMRAVMGPDIRLATLGANTISPQDGTVFMGPWHLDYPYRESHNRQRMPPPEHPVSVHVIFPVDDFTLRNGATEVLPGSHLEPQPDLLGNHGSPPGAIQIQLAAGHALVMHGGLWHRQRPNVSLHPRHAILATYTPEWVCPQDNMEGQWHAIMHSQHLAPNVLTELRELLLGPHKRGLSMCGLQLRHSHT